MHEERRLEAVHCVEHLEHDNGGADDAVVVGTRGTQIRRTEASLAGRPVWISSNLVRTHD